MCSVPRSALPGRYTCERQPWLKSPYFDCALIVGPGILISLFVLAAFPRASALMRAEMPLSMWFILVIGIDVAHVYSTLYRTYFDPDERSRHAALLVVVPIACWVLGALVYSLSSLVFWSALAYLAVFHFIRQQYGFYALYSRWPEDRVTWSREIDTAFVYLATLAPLLYWHEHLPRAFVWFVDGDFPFRAPLGTSRIALAALGCVALVQFLKELLQLSRCGRINIPKNLLLWGTALSWMTGIVLFNGDIPFTLTNVVAHGVPYIALIWAFGRRKSLQSPGEMPAWLSVLFSPRNVLLFLVVVLGFAYGEEALWDAVVWRERPALFGWLWTLPHVKDSRLLALLVPLLAVPQATHYVLDAFIWRIRNPHTEVHHLLTTDPSDLEGDSSIKRPVTV